MIDGREQAADLAEGVALRRVGEVAVLDQGVENVGLADRDEMVPIAGGVSLPAIGRGRGHGWSCGLS